MYQLYLVYFILHNNEFTNINSYIKTNQPPVTMECNLYSIKLNKGTQDL